MSNTNVDPNIWNISLNSSFKPSSPTKKSKIIGKNISFKGKETYIYQYKDITIIGYGRIYNEYDLWTIILNISPPYLKIHPLMIVIELYRKFGFEKTLEYLEGDFSFLLFDINIYGEEALLYVVRDALGLSPLYQWIPNTNSKKVQFYNETTDINQIQYLFSSAISTTENIDNLINEPIQNGTYLVFTHSFKVSANWKYKNTVHYYKLPFHSTYEKDTKYKPYLQEIEISITKRIRYILTNESRMYNNEETEYICEEYKNIQNTIKEQINTIKKTKNIIGVIVFDDNDDNDNNKRELSKNMVDILIKNENLVDYKIISFVDKNTNELEEKYPTVIQQIKKYLNNNDPSIIRAYFIPLIIAKYIKENEPQIRYVFMGEPFIYKWIFTNIFDRREELNDVFFQERLKGWIDAFFEYDIELMIPYLDRTLLQKI